jgi:hypothetical protein
MKGSSHAPSQSKLAKAVNPMNPMTNVITVVKKATNELDVSAEANIPMAQNAEPKSAKPK